LSIANKRRQSGSVERYSDLLCQREGAEVEEVCIAVVGDQ